MFFKAALGAWHVWGHHTGNGLASKVQVSQPAMKNLNLNEKFNSLLSRTVVLQVYPHLSSTRIDNKCAVAVLRSDYKRLSCFYHCIK